MIIFLNWKALIALLFIKKITILNKYWDFTNVSSKNLAKVILKYTKINKYTIKLKKNK